MAVYFHVRGHLQGKKRKEWLPAVCLMCGAAANASDITLLGVCTDVSLAVVLTITAQLRASRGQIRRDRCMSDRNLSPSQTRFCSLRPLVEML